MKSLGKKKQTNRGFPLIEFKDAFNEECSLQVSSSGGGVWLGCNNNAQPHHITNEPLSPRMNLKPYQIERLIYHLNNFLKTGNF